MMMDRNALLSRLTAIRNAIHACNRPNVRDGKRLEWRDMIDRLIVDVEKNMPACPHVNAED